MNFWFALALIAGTVLVLRFGRACLIVACRVSPTMHRSLIKALDRRAAQEHEECAHGGRRCLP